MKALISQSIRKNKRATLYHLKFALIFIDSSLQKVFYDYIFKISHLTFYHEITTPSYFLSIL